MGWNYTLSYTDSLCARAKGRVILAKGAAILPADGQGEERPRCTRDMVGVEDAMESFLRQRRNLILISAVLVLTRFVDLPLDLD